MITIAKTDDIITRKALMISNKPEVKMIAVKNKRGAKNQNPKAIEG